jgi:lipoprotein-anchoring transpeptidase ErfK/SrfK
MRGFVVACIVLAAGSEVASAQSWVPWHQSDIPGSRRTLGRDAPPAQGQPVPAARAQALRQQASLIGAPPVAGLEKPKPVVGPAVLEGGPRPSISPQAPQSVAVRTGHDAGTVVIDTSARRLYLMQSSTSALVYPISVGREGFTWTGTEKISRVADWPDWRPPAEMRQRQPELPELMTGGLRNPLGAKALYLGNSLYRIHGTNSAQSIGRANSSGCFRMTNSHVVDLASRIGVGTTVVVKRRI